MRETIVARVYIVKRKEGEKEKEEDKHQRSVGSHVCTYIIQENTDHE